MKTYVVRAVRWERGWELHIDGVGVTQTAKLSRADDTVRDFLMLDGHDDADTADVHFAYAGAGVEKYVEAFVHAHEAAAVAETAAAEAARRSRIAVHGLVTDVGLSGQDVARILGVSPQRVSQLLGALSAGSVKKVAAAKVAVGKPVTTRSTVSAAGRNDTLKSRRAKG